MSIMVILRAGSCARAEARAWTRRSCLFLCLALAACDDGAPDTSADADPIEIGDAGVSEPVQDAEDEPTAEDTDASDDDGGSLASDASSTEADAANVGLDAQTALPDATATDTGTAADAPGSTESDAGNADAAMPRCSPNCAGRACGDDGCGGACGQCQTGRTCSAGSCVCTPNCMGKSCGDDGCGGSCGPCVAPAQCDTRLGMCVASCTRQCTGKVCGDDGCGGSCGPCASNQACNAQGTQCQCVPNCVGRACGDNGCGGSCGPCASGTMCNAQGACVCAPSCAGRMCGSNGCGGSCGECTTGSCNASGQCVVTVTSFSADVYPILTTAGCPGCHRVSSSAPAAGLALTPVEAAYVNLVSGATTRCSSAGAFVAPGNPAGSYLVNKLTGVGICGGRMPLNRTPLSNAQIDVIRAWISSGAAP